MMVLALVPIAHLDGKHTVFGRVLEGMEVVAALKKRNPQELSPHAPDVPDRILRAEVVRDRGHEYAFEKLGVSSP